MCCSIVWKPLFWPFWRLLFYWEKKIKKKTWVSYDLARMLFYLRLLKITPKQLSTLGKSPWCKAKVVLDKNQFSSIKKKYGVFSTYVQVSTNCSKTNSFSLKYCFQISTLIFHFDSRNVKLCSGINHLWRHENQYTNWNHQWKQLFSELVMLWCT